MAIVDTSLFLSPYKVKRTYVPKCVSADGTASYLSRAAFVGVSNGKVGTISLWINSDVDAAAGRILSIDGDKLLLTKTANDNIQLIGKDAATGLTTQLSIASATDTIEKGDGWVHVLIAWDLTTLGAELSTIYINGVASQTVTTAIGAVDMEYTGTSTLCSTNTPDTFFDGQLSEVYINLAEYVDFTVASNIALFRTTDGRPVSLGSTGSTPTGTAPAVYLRRDGLNFHKNAGTAGDFTSNGTFANASPP